MQRILAVARREYVETVKSKTFLFGLLMTPVMIGMILYFTSRAARGRDSPRPDRTVAVTDLSGSLSAEIKASFDAHNARHPQQRILLQDLPAGRGDRDVIAERQKDKVRGGRLDAYVVVDEDVVDGSGKIHLYGRGSQAAEMQARLTVENLLNRAVVNRRCALRNVSPELLAELRRRVTVEQIDLGASAGDERTPKGDQRVAAMMVPFFFMFMMFMGVFGMGQHMLSSVIEEKNSRVIEVLLSAVSPFQLMAGKIAGLAGIGLTVLSLWGGTAYAAARWRGVSISVGPEILPYFVVYYVLGFLLFAALLAGIGSVCNTIKEAQSLMAPVTMLAVIPMIAWFNVAQHPTGTLATVLSFVPPLTPLVMIVRIAASPQLPPLEIVGSIVLLAVSVPATIWLAARVFRIGILMYGKRPGLREVLRWMSQA